VLVRALTSRFLAHRSRRPELGDPLGEASSTGPDAEDVEDDYSAPSADRTHPMTGVDVYDTSGFEESDIRGGARHDYPAETAVTYVRR